MGSGWVRAGGFDPASGGDALLVYQGSEASPSFLYGFGFRPTSWITSGATTSANSYLPAALSSVTAYNTMGSVSRNYQYMATGNYGVFSDEFLTDLHDFSHWSASGSSAAAGMIYPQTIVPFDATRPTFDDAVRRSPATEAVTSGSSLVFRITTSEPVQPLGSNDFTVATTGAVIYDAVTTVMIDASTYEIVVSGV